MQSFFSWLDSIAAITTEKTSAKWLERTAFLFLILMILAAPHSIAATQTAWLIGMFAWFVRQFIKPRLTLVRTPLDIALWAFFGWTVLTALTSYAPDISLDKLRNAALFLIFYFIINLVRTKRAVYFLTFALIFSTAVVSLWTPIERIIGRGVQIANLKDDSPLKKAILEDGDTLLETNKKKIKTPEDLTRALESNERATVIVNRRDFNFEIVVKRAELLNGETASEQLGIGSWQPSRVWRAQGFFSHFTTFAEFLQLVGSLAFGLLIVLINSKLSKNNELQISNFKSYFIFLIIALAAILIALLLSVTRASQLAFVVSAAVIVLLCGNRKLLFGLAVILLPLALIGAFLLQQNRRVGFADAKDGSTQYRLMMYRDGLRLWTSNARNFTVGVGMDSTKRYWREWDLYDKGWQPMGHFHSTPVQLTVERGFPALLLWLWVLLIYARTLWKNLRFKIQNSKFKPDWRENGILLGALGGLIGFFTSGLVHYNYGDAVVAMAFFMIMGLSVKLGLIGER